MNRQFRIKKILNLTPLPPNPLYLGLKNLRITGAASAKEGQIQSGRTLVFWLRIFFKDSSPCPVSTKIVLQPARFPA
jgi:hypothetical protein